MDLHDSVAVVTGSNRGLGREFAAQLLERGAKKVYATARNPESVQIAGVTPLGSTSPTRTPLPGRPQLPATPR